MAGTITQSRVKEGTFTLTAGGGAAVSFACQTTNIRLTPTYDDDGDRLETLCGAEAPPGKKESWALAGTSVQDFDDPAGFIRFCRDNAMTDVPFEWLPNAVGAELVSGIVQVLALEYGGDVNSQLTTDFEFACVGKPVWTDSPDKGSASAGDVFPADSNITASDSTNAAKLAGLGYVASPQTAWATGEKMTVGTYDFNWSGTAWAAGAHA